MIRADFITTVFANCRDNPPRAAARAGSATVTDRAPDEQLRIDSWLFRTRFYKSRSLAATAVAGGRVHLNGARIKSSRGVRLGDELALTHPQGRYRLQVRSMPARRGPAGESAEYYEVLEFEPAQSRRPNPAGVSNSPRKRPDKRGRRRLRALKGKA